MYFSVCLLYSLAILTRGEVTRVKRRKNNSVKVKNVIIDDSNVVKYKFISIALFAIDINPTAFSVGRVSPDLFRNNSVSFLFQNNLRL